MEKEEKYKKLIQDILSKTKTDKALNESRVRYDEAHSERMLPKLERDLRERKHSLGDHPIFPESDELHFEEKIIGERFGEVIREVKRYFNTNDIDNVKIMQEMYPMIKECMKIEEKNKKELEELAIKMIRDEYNIPEDMVEIEAELTPNINMEGTKLNAIPIRVDEVDFDSHEDIAKANSEVYKRRFINAMNQGAAMKTNHMFHMVDEDLTKIDPTLPTKYGKIMSAADYMYYIVDNIDNSPAITGGIVKLELPTNENGIPKIKAQAMIFPVLIHELVKGVMELLAAHGLPKNPKIRNYVLGKADYLKAETWDMRLGPALWSKLTKLIPPEDFHLKHYLYADLCSLPVEKFNSDMREIMAGTKLGKDIVNKMLTKIKIDLQKEEFNRVMDERRQESERSSNIIDNTDDLEDYWNQIGF